MINRREYIIQKDMFLELRKFLKKSSKSDEAEMMHISAIPGIEQPGLRIIRYVYETDEVDDYGKPITEKRVIIDYDSRFDGSERISTMFVRDSDDFITLDGERTQYQFIPTDSPEQYFKERYYNDILMRLIKLRGMDEGHLGEIETMIEAIKEIRT